MQIGLIGLGVMGRNLALNMRDAGFDVVATDAWESARAWRARGVRVVEDEKAGSRGGHGGGEALAPAEGLDKYLSVFTTIGLVLLGISLIIVIFNKRLQKLMHGVV